MKRGVFWKDGHVMRVTRLIAGGLVVKSEKRVSVINTLTQCMCFGANQDLWHLHKYMKGANNNLLMPL